MAGEDPTAGTANSYDGEALMNEVYDLMRRRLPRLSPHDRYRPVLSWFLIEMGRRLGRQRLAAL